MEERRYISDVRMSADGKVTVILDDGSILSGLTQATVRHELNNFSTVELTSFLHTKPGSPFISK